MPRATSRSKSPARTATAKKGASASRTRAVFDKLDTDGSGFLDVDEVEAALVHLKLSTGNLDGMFADADTDGDGQVDFAEFEAAIKTSKPWAKVENKTFAETVAKMLDAGDKVLEPVHRMVRQCSVPAATEGHVKPSGGLRLAGSLVGSFVDTLALAIVIAVSCAVFVFCVGWDDALPGSSITASTLASGGVVSYLVLFNEIKSGPLGNVILAAFAMFYYFWIGHLWSRG